MLHATEIFFVIFGHEAGGSVKMVKAEVVEGDPKPKIAAVNVAKAKAVKVVKPKPSTRRLLKWGPGGPQIFFLFSDTP